MIEISSAQNEHFKRWKDLDSSRGIKKHQEFFLMGEKLIEEFLKNPQFVVKAELICEGHRPITMNLKNEASGKRIPIYKLTKTLFSEVDFLGTHYNLLLLEPREIESLESNNQQLPPQAMQIIAPLGDPNNLGALLRSALAFNVHSVILTQESCSPYLPKAIKSSAGAALKMKILKTAQNLEQLIPTLDKVVALDMVGTDIREYKMTSPQRILIGEEGPGISAGLKVARVKIPTSGVESLNATVAASIALWHLSQKNIKGSN